MDMLDEEILDLWKEFKKQNLQYILVGGFATNLHGFQRTTGDLDVWIKDTDENRKSLRKALKNLKIGDFPSIETMEFIPGWSGISLLSGFELDIMTTIKGFDQESFDTCYQSASVAYIHEIPIRFLHINQLIENKTKTGRPKDKLDVMELKKIRKGKS